MNKELTHRQRLSIEALVLTNTIAQAAKKAKVGERTIYAWLTQDHFQSLRHDMLRRRAGGTLGALLDNLVRSAWTTAACDPRIVDFHLSCQTEISATARWEAIRGPRIVVCPSCLFAL